MEPGADTVIESLTGGRYAAPQPFDQRTVKSWARFGSSSRPSRSARISTSTAPEYLIGVVAILVALVLGSWFLARRLARPIGVMVQAARTVEDGQQPQPSTAAMLRNTSLTRDEYGELAGVFLDMAREVGAREVRLNALVEERTVELSDKNRTLEDTQREIRNDLEMAHSVQAALVPSTCPTTPEPASLPS